MSRKLTGSQILDLINRNGNRCAVQATFGGNRTPVPKAWVNKYIKKLGILRKYWVHSTRTPDGNQQIVLEMFMNERYDLVLKGNEDARKDRFPRVDEKGNTYHRYNCPHCDAFVDMYQNPLHPLCKVLHHPDCRWAEAWRTIRTA